MKERRKIDFPWLIKDNIHTCQTLLLITSSIPECKLCGSEAEQKLSKSCGVYIFGFVLDMAFLAPYQIK